MKRACILLLTMVYCGCTTPKKECDCGYQDWNKPENGKHAFWCEVE